jgi:hypothetical protein
MNDMIMPSYLPRNRVVVSKEMFMHNIKITKPLKKAFDIEDFDYEEVIENVQKYAENMSRLA